MGNRWLPLTVLTFAHFFNDFFQFIIPLFLPLFVLEFGLSYFEGGLLLAVYLGSAVFLNAVMGHLADRYRKRKLLMCLGLALYGISVSMLQFAQSYFTLIIISIVMGIGFSSYHPQATHIITSLYKDHKGKFMGIHGIGGSVGFFATPLLLAPLAYTIGWRYAVSFLFIPACIAALLLWIFLKEPVAETVRVSRKTVWRPVILLALMYGLCLFAFRGFVNFLPAYFISRGNTAIEMGLLTSLVMATGIVAEPLGGALSDKIGRKKTFTISLSILTLSLLFFLNSVGLIAILFLIMVGFWGQATRPVGMAYSSELGPVDTVGTRVGVVFGGAQGMSLLSTITVGYMADLVGFYWAYMALVAVAGMSVFMTFAMPEIKNSY